MGGDHNGTHSEDEASGPPSDAEVGSSCSSVSLLQPASTAYSSSRQAPPCRKAHRLTKRLAAACMSAAAMLLSANVPPMSLTCRRSKRGAARAIAVAQALLAEQGSQVSRYSDVAFDAAAACMMLNLLTGEEVVSACRCVHTCQCA